MQHPIPQLVDGPSLALGASVLVAGAVSVVTKEKAAAWLAVLLGWMWIYTKLAAAMWGWDTARTLFPAGDVFALTIFCVAWFAKPEQWRLGIVFAVLTKLFVHVIYWRHGLATIHTRADNFNYGLALNILYAIEVMCVFIGGGRGIGAAIGAWISAHWPGHRWSHASSRRPAQSEKA